MATKRLAFRDEPRYEIRTQQCKHINDYITTLGNLQMMSILQVILALEKNKLSESVACFVLFDCRQ